MQTEKIKIQRTRASKFDSFKEHPKRAQCTKCGSKRTYTNPMARCHECKKKFCFDHIFGGQINDKMGRNEAIRDVCELCKRSGDYRDL